MPDAEAPQLREAGRRPEPIRAAHVKRKAAGGASNSGVPTPWGEVASSLPQAGSDVESAAR